ncbi:hypothetical protein K2173_022695 [Erythroxylum novogranatense]|uniref:CHCH domain-containing protein n=1 Tax=Erythroxylum novogranatense TaxID=1862640 RepID=A0AAV8TR32_9ROSI|nr:hypothetical protein K2173_022695 [Erythroxylum novogranatense]
MPEEEARANAVCAQEALNLLNCVADSSYDHEKCVTLLNALRQCVINKKVKKFILADEGQLDTNPVAKKP